jgi:DNA polymerase-3 subunit beta
MKVSCLHENITKGLSIVGRAVASRSTLPVLGNVLLSTDKSGLKLSATNLEMGITCWIGAKVHEEGSTTLPAKTLIDLVGTLPRERIDLELDARTQTMQVACAEFTNEIKCIGSDEFPVLPSAEDDHDLEINVSNLREMIDQVVFVAATDDSRPVLTGVEVKIENETLTFAAADGFRLAVCTSSLSGSDGTDVDVIIPARALAELARIIGDESDVVSITMPPNGGQVIFRVRDVELVCQLIEGKFPDYQQLLPDSYQTRVVMSTEKFLGACRAAQIFARESSYAVTLSVKSGDNPGEDRLEVSANAAETGSNESSIESSLDGDPVEIAFNVRYLTEVLRVIGTPDVALETNGEASPGVLRPVGREDFVSVVMPMHVGR